MIGIEGIIKWSLMASSVIVLVTVARQILKEKIKKTWQYGLWLIVLARLLIPELPTSSLSFFNAFNVFTQEIAVEKDSSDEVVYLDKINETAGIENEIVTFWEVQVNKAMPKEVRDDEVNLSRSRGVPSSYIMWSIWMIGGLGVLSYFALGYHAIKKKFVGFKEIEDQEILQLEELVRHKIGVKNKARIVEGEMPVVFGILEPIISIPQGYNKENLEIILTHEYMHFKYKDHWITYIQILALAIHWFNPLVWLAMSWMKKDMELACDERVITSGVSRKQYASILLKMTVNSRGQTYLLQGMGEKQKEIKRRVLHIAHFKPKKKWISVIGMGMITMLAVGCLTNAKQEEISPNSMLAESQERSEKKALIPNIALLGIDQDGMRVDAIMVAHVNEETGQMQVISVPRDTKVEWDEEQKTLLLDQAPDISKLSEMTAYGGLSNIQALTIKEVEEMLGMTIPYYAIIDMASVEKFIDSIGGIEIDIPQDMKYIDSAQNLEIDLSKGHQLLDGGRVLDFVRYRRYPEGDIKRIDMQQQVVESFMKQLTSRENKEEVLSAIMNVVKEVNTNIKFEDIPLYWKRLWGLDINQLEYITVPGEGKYEEGRSYFIVDVNESHLLFKNN